MVSGLDSEAIRDFIKDSTEDLLHRWDSVAFPDPLPYKPDPGHDALAGIFERREKSRGGRYVVGENYVFGRDGTKIKLSGRKARCLRGAKIITEKLPMGNFGYKSPGAVAKKRGSSKSILA